MRRWVNTLSCAALLSLLSAAFAGISASAQHANVKISQAVDSVAYVAVDFAKLRGFYSEEGLNVDQLIMAGGGPDFTALLSGDVQFNTAAPSYQLNGIKQSRRVLQVENSIMAMNQSLVLSKAAVAKTGLAPDAPVKQRLAALKGMKIAITRPGAMTDVHMQFLMRYAGLKAGDVQLVSIGAPQSMISALESGDIDGFVISIGPDRVAVSRGAVMWIDNLRGDVPGLSPMPTVGLYVMEAYAEKNPGIVRRFVKATQRAVKEMSERPLDEVVAVLKARYTSMDPAVLRLSIEAVKPAFNITGNVTREMAENLVAFMPEAQGLTAEQYLGFYTNRFLKD